MKSDSVYLSGDGWFHGFVIGAMVFVLGWLYCVGRPDVVVFSNDGPLGSLVNAQVTMPSSTVVLWEDSNWIGGPGVARITDSRPGWRMICLCLMLTILPWLAFYKKLAAADLWLLCLIVMSFLVAYWSFSVMMWYLNPDSTLALDPYTDDKRNWIGIGLMKSLLYFMLWGGVVEGRTSSHSRWLFCASIPFIVSGVVLLLINAFLSYVH